jgi:hypothetical protein
MSKCPKLGHFDILGHFFSNPLNFSKVYLTMALDIFGHLDMP